MGALAHLLLHLDDVKNWRIASRSYSAPAGEVLQDQSVDIKGVLTLFLIKQKDNQRRK